MGVLGLGLLAFDALLGGMEQCILMLPLLLRSALDQEGGGAQVRTVHEGALVVVQRRLLQQIAVPEEGVLHLGSGEVRPDTREDVPGLVGGVGDTALGTLEARLPFLEVLVPIPRVGEEALLGGLIEAGVREDRAVAGIAPLFSLAQAHPQEDILRQFSVVGELAVLVDVDLELCPDRRVGHLAGRQILVRHGPLSSVEDGETLR